MPAVSGSAVSQIMEMRGGTTFSRSVYIPYEKADPDRIKEARRSLVSYLTPVVARAKRRKDRNYRVHTVTAHTSVYDVIVTGVIVIEPPGRQESDEV